MATTGSAADMASQSDFFSRDLADADTAVHDAIEKELTRQQTQIELIASENIVSKAVLEATGLPLPILKTLA